MAFNPLVSVIVPVYNVAPFLRQCLDSLCEQSYKNLEIILINDGSTDESGAICDEYARKDDRIKVIHQDNKGQSSARNKGLNIAQGEYISFVDSDDWLELNMYTTLLKVFEQHPSWSFISFGIFRKPRHAHLKGSAKLRCYQGLELFGCLQRGTITSLCCDKIYHRKAVEHIRFAEGYFSEDIDFALRVFTQEAISGACYDKRLYHYRTDHSGRTTLRPGNRLFDDALDLWLNFLRESKTNKTQEQFQRILAMLLHFLIACETDILKGLKRRRISADDAYLRRERLQAIWIQLKPQIAKLPRSFLSLRCAVYLIKPSLYHLVKRPTQYLKYNIYLPN